MKIFLDDYRQPFDCIKYMHTRIGALNTIYDEGDWFTVLNYSSFVMAIESYNQEITVVSFDHDLSDGHYHQNMQEGVINYDSPDFDNDDHKTGYHAAKFMKEFYESKGLELPKIIVHSQNDVGAENISKLFYKIS